MNKYSVERDIRPDKEALKKLRHELAHQKPEQQQPMLQYYTLMQQSVKEKARRAALQNMSLHVLSFIAAISWERALRTTIERFLQGKQTEWRVNTMTALGVTIVTVGLAARWAVMS